MDIEAETRRILQFVDDGNFHAAINIALSGLNASRRDQDQAFIDLRLVQGLFDLLSNVDEFVMLFGVEPEIFRV